MSKHNTFGKGHKERAVNGGSDKYYTKQYLADYISNLIYERFGEASYVEPTAGSGAFLKILPNIIGYDLFPEVLEIKQQNVFDLIVEDKTVIIGNPPFGTNASTALKIFNHFAAQHCKAICFILPKTFKKKSIQNKLHINYHLTFYFDLPENSFTVEGNDYNVPCVFQIWEYKNKERNINNQEPCLWFDFVEKNSVEQNDVALRRAGGRAGQVLKGLNYSASSTYFIRVKDPVVKKALALIDYNKFTENTVGVKSISKKELCSEVNRIMDILVDYKPEEDVKLLF